MKIKNLIKITNKPALYEAGTAAMWTDKYISKQLLKTHLNTEIDLASRKMKTIETTVAWILENTPKKPGMKILDLGCGPGLYTNLLAQKGYEVTGVDFSFNSIDYAKREAEAKQLNIEYINANYLELDMEANTYDLVILIFTDLGVLLPEERQHMLAYVHKILKPGGTFIFDVLNDKNMEQKQSPKNWEAAQNGFWKPGPYVALSESFLYEKEKVILYQHLLVSEKDEIDVYRFWTHFFSHADLKNNLLENGFTEFEFYDNVLPEGDLWNGDNVTFTVARKEL